jgi:hypothetical protein
MLSACIVFAQNKLASYESRQQALASHWLDLFANTPQCLTTENEVYKHKPSVNFSFKPQGIFIFDLKLKESTKYLETATSLLKT